MRVYQLDSTQLQHSLTPTNMCNGVLQYYQYKQYTVVSVLGVERTLKDFIVSLIMDFYKISSKYTNVIKHCRTLGNKRKI